MCKRLTFVEKNGITKLINKIVGCRPLNGRIFRHRLYFQFSDNSRFFFAFLIKFRNCMPFYPHFITKSTDISYRSTYPILKLVGYGYNILKLESCLIEDRLRGTPFVERIVNTNSSSTIHDYASASSVDERIVNTFSYTITSKNSMTLYREFKKRSLYAFQ